MSPCGGTHLPCRLAARLLIAGVTASDGLQGQVIGAYTLRELIGRGGMATVYAADRSDGSFKQPVAVKILRRNLHSELEQRLFARERQALAGTRAWHA